MLVCAEFDRPTPDSLVGDDDPALEQHFLNEAQAQREAKIEPYGMCDVLWRKSVTL